MDPCPNLEMRSGKSANLDFLRSVAVLLVFACHYFTIKNGTGSPGSFLWHIGRLGVLIFFVHTSLVLMWSLERVSITSNRMVAPFYVRRIMRIYPLSIVCVLFAYIFDARWVPANLSQNLTLAQYLTSRASAVFPNILGSLWTLPLEVEMYLALPILFLLLRHRSLIFLAGLWAACAGLALVQPRWGDQLLLLRFVPCFLGGVVTWRLIRNGVRGQLPGWLWPAGIAAASMIWMAAGDRVRPLFMAVFGVALGLLVPLFQEMASIRIGAVSKVIARYSYGIYLTHFPIMVYVLSAPSPGHPRFRWIPPLPVIRHGARPLDLLLVLVMTGIASFVLYHVVEDPGIRLGRMLSRWLEQPAGEARLAAREDAPAA